jgi:hypothetical protein
MHDITDFIGLPAERADLLTDSIQFLLDTLHHGDRIIDDGLALRGALISFGRHVQRHARRLLLLNLLLHLISNIAGDFATPYSLPEASYKGL